MSSSLHLLGSLSRHLLPCVMADIPSSEVSSGLRPEFSVFNVVRDDIPSVIFIPDLHIGLQSKYVSQHLLITCGFSLT